MQHHIGFLQLYKRFHWAHGKHFDQQVTNQMVNQIFIGYLGKRLIDCCCCCCTQSAFFSTSSSFSWSHASIVIVTINYLLLAYGKWFYNRCIFYGRTQPRIKTQIILKHAESRKSAGFLLRVWFSPFCSRFFFSCFKTVLVCGIEMHSYMSRVENFLKKKHTHSNRCIDSYCLFWL